MKTSSGQGVPKHQRKARGTLTRRPPAAFRPQRRPFWDQVNNNLVALISLVLAITSLGYNTWRNEKTEIQRNWRQASFQILIEVGELNQIILLRRYFPEAPNASRPSSGDIQNPHNWVTGWGKATMIRDLSQALPDPLPEAGRRLFEAWQEHAGDLDDRGDPEAREEATQELLDAVEHLRTSTVQLIAELT